jgi:hypothetical protein
MPGRKAEYDSLAFAVICVIFISLIFWIVSLSTDIALVLSPQAVNSCLGGLGKARKGLMAQAHKSLKMGKASGSTGKRLSAKQSLPFNADVDPNEVQFEQNVDLLQRNLRGGAAEDGLSMTDLRRLVLDLQSRLEDAENQNGPKSNTYRTPTKRSFEPVQAEDVKETKNVVQQVQLQRKETPAKQMFKMSDLKMADAEATSKQAKQKSNAGGRLQGKVVIKKDEKVSALSMSSAGALLPTDLAIAQTSYAEQTIEINESKVALLAGSTLDDTTSLSENQNAAVTIKHEEDEV